MSDQPGPRTPLSPKLRFDILERDQHACRLCGTAAGAATLEIDHLIPLAQGGTTTKENLLTLCWTCNRGKGGRMPSMGTIKFLLKTDAKFGPRDLTRRLTGSRFATGDAERKAPRQSSTPPLQPGTACALRTSAVKEWMAIRCTSAPRGRSQCSTLFEDYQRWATTAERDPLNVHTFGRILKALSPAVRASRGTLYPLTLHPIDAPLQNHDTTTALPAATHQ